MSTTPIHSETNGGDGLRDQIHMHLREHECLRRRVLNLTASENVVSTEVLDALANDLVGRYSNYRRRDLEDRIYPGTEHLGAIEHIIDELLRCQFGAQFAEARPLSGQVAGLAALRATMSPGALVLEISDAVGGHDTAVAFARITFDSVRIGHLPFDEDAFNIDVARAVQQIEQERPRVVLLGSSNFLFPHPIGPIAEATHNVDGLVIYDGSHVMGLLASGHFQDPLAEGADLIFGSTHKTMPGPQGGVIVGKDQRIADSIADAIADLQTNYHPFRMPSMALALVELSEHGSAYSAAMIEAAQTLAAALVNEGLEVVQADGRHTESHSVLVATRNLGGADQLVGQLESAGIMTTATRLPRSWGSEGIRIGTQEVARHNVTPQQLQRIAELFADTALGRRQTIDTENHVRELAADMGPVGFVLAPASQLRGQSLRIETP